MSATKGPLNLRVAYYENDHVTDAAFIMHEIVDESVVPTTRDDEVLDIRGEISGLLDSWKFRGKIKAYALKEAAQINPVLLKGALEIADAELGRKEIHTTEIRAKIRSYARDYGRVIILAIVEALAVWLFSRLLPQAGP
jgi:hypothetical protein